MIQKDNGGPSDVHKTIGGTAGRSAVAFAIKSSNPSSSESERVAWMSMSTVHPRCRAHRNPSTPSEEFFVKMVDKDVRTVVVVKRVSMAGSGFSRSKGTMKETT